MDEAIRQAGAIVMRQGASSSEVLLILSKKNPQVRIFPKGHIEQGETTRATAARELLEEAGIRGDYAGEAGTACYEFRGKQFHVTYHTFIYTGTVADGEPGRDPSWYSPEEARALLMSDELKTVLQRALEKK